MVIFDSQDDRNILCKHYDEYDHCSACDTGGGGGRGGSELISIANRFVMLCGLLMNYLCLIVEYRM